MYRPAGVPTSLVRHALRASHSSTRIIQQAAPAAAQAFSTTTVRASNIGASSITIPEGVTVAVSQKQIDPIARLRMELNSKRKGKPVINLTQEATVTGPRGVLTVDLADFVNLDIEDAHQTDTPAAASQQPDGLKKMTVRVNDEKDKPQRSMWGTTRSLINNGIIGVTEGHIAIVKFVGTGFRASLEKDAGKEYVSLKVGYCVPIRVDIPEGIKIQLPLPHRMIIEGNDKQQVKLLAAEIRKHRKPEPYKGKGIFVDGETIKLKARKIK